jgi:uncharacterized caspase-like protein
MTSIATFLALCAVGGVHVGSAAQTPVSPDHLRKVALVVGNAGYVNAAALPNALHDASDICSALRQLDFDVICKLNVASKRDFKDAIYQFTGKVDEKSVALFYYAGHGVQLDGLNYVIPINAALRTKSDIEDESLQINYLMNELETRHAALNLFVLDACRNNPFINPIRGYAPALGMASQLYAPQNSIIAMSTGPGQLSLDGAGRNGTFTKNLLAAILMPRQPVEDMLKVASRGTSADAKQLGQRQDPQITTSYSDKFCLAGCAVSTIANAGQLRQKAAELSNLQLTIAETVAQQAELEQQKAALLKQREEISRIRAAVNVEADSAIQSRKVEAPPPAKKPMTILPVF